MRGHALVRDGVCVWKTEGGLRPCSDTDRIVFCNPRGDALHSHQAQTYCYLPTDATLTPATLQAVGKAFATLRGAGVKALFRFAYDRAMPGENTYTADTILGESSLA